MSILKKHIETFFFIALAIIPQIGIAQNLPGRVDAGTLLAELRGMVGTPNEMLQDICKDFQLEDAKPAIRSYLYPVFIGASDSHEPLLDEWYTTNPNQLPSYLPAFVKETGYLGGKVTIEDILCAERTNHSTIIRNGKTLGQLIGSTIFRAESSFSPRNASTKITRELEMIGNEHDLGNRLSNSNTVTQHVYSATEQFYSDILGKRYNLRRSVSDEDRLKKSIAHGFFALMVFFPDSDYVLDYIQQNNNRFSTVGSVVSHSLTSRELSIEFYRLARSMKIGPLRSYLFGKMMSHVIFTSNQYGSVSAGLSPLERIEMAQNLVERITAVQEAFSNLIEQDGSFVGSRVIALGIGGVLRVSRRIASIVERFSSRTFTIGILQDVHIEPEVDAQIIGIDYFGGRISGRLGLDWEFLWF